MFPDVLAEYPDAARYTLVQLLVVCNVVLQDSPTYIHTYKYCYSHRLASLIQ